MKLTWLCPTWNRPECLRGLVRQFLAQDFQANEIELLILDDSGQYKNQSGDNGSGGKRWQIISFNRPFATLGDKYNAMLSMVDSDAVAIAEDDDLYSPQHSSACIHALQFGDTCKPTCVMVEHRGLHEESDPGRFHASMAMNTAFLKRIGGWPATKQANFDLQMIAKLRSSGTVVCPQQGIIYSPDGSSRLAPEQHIRFNPTYTFRWETTGHYHGQAYGSGPLDEGWLEKARIASGPIRYVGNLFQ